MRISFTGLEVIMIRKLGGRVGRPSRRVLMRPRRVSRVPCSSRASNMIRTGWATLFASVDNGC